MQGSREPEERVGTAENKGSNEEAGHSPKCPKEERIFVGIVMGCVREVSCKTSSGAWMTFLARSNNVVVTQMRLGICNGTNIVSAVTIVTFCRLGVTELRDFSVVGVEVRGGDLLMTPPAFSHDVEFKSRNVRTANGVRGMTIVADREFLVRLILHGAMDALHKLFLDPVMVSTTRDRYILGVHA